MCIDPKAAVGLQALGALQASAGAYMQTSGERRKLEADANIADLNARLSDLTAKSALQQGQREEQISRIDTRNIKEAQTVGYAGNNIALDSETAIRVATSTDVLGEIDAKTINMNAARAAWGYRLEGVQFRNEALITRTTAKSLSPTQSAFTSLLSNAGNVAESYVRLKKSGAFDDPVGKTGKGTGKVKA